jgi:hypothetical protein
MLGWSRYSQHPGDVAAQSERPTSDKYDMGILKTSRYDVETSSQEAMVSDKDART